jgi:hypothetical protein
VTGVTRIAKPGTAIGAVSASLASTLVSVPAGTVV